MPLSGPSKIGFDVGGAYADITTINPLPMSGGTSAETTVVISSLAATAAIDTGNYRWASVQMTAGYSGMTSLTPQCSNDSTTWFSAAMYGVGNTSSGISTNMGTSAAIQLIPLPFRYLRFNPAGTYSSGSCTLKVTLYSEPQFMASVGANANIAAVGSSVAPPISTSAFTIGTGTGQLWQRRLTGSATVSSTSLVAAVSGQIAYVTEVHWSYVGTGAPVLALAAASSAQTDAPSFEIVMSPDASRSRYMRHPWKPTVTTNIALNYVISGTFTGTYYLHIAGYYNSS